MFQHLCRKVEEGNIQISSQDVALHLSLLRNRYSVYLFQRHLDHNVTVCQLSTNYSLLALPRFPRVSQGKIAIEKTAFVEDRSIRRGDVYNFLLHDCGSICKHEARRNILEYLLNFPQLHLFSQSYLVKHTFNFALKHCRLSDCWKQLADSYFSAFWTQSPD